MLISLPMMLGVVGDEWSQKPKLTPGSNLGKGDFRGRVLGVFESSPRFVPEMEIHGCEVDRGRRLHWYRSVPPPLPTGGGEQSKVLIHPATGEGADIEESVGGALITEAVFEQIIFESHRSPPSSNE